MDKVDFRTSFLDLICFEQLGQVAINQELSSSDEVSDISINSKFLIIIFHL